MPSHGSRGGEGGLTVRRYSAIRLKLILKVESIVINRKKRYARNHSSWWLRSVRLKPSFFPSDLCHTYLFVNVSFWGGYNDYIRILIRFTRQLLARVLIQCWGGLWGRVIVVTLLWRWIFREFSGKGGGYIGMTSFNLIWLLPELCIF